jgi:MFS family permease
MLGTYIGGWPTEKFGARRVLVMTTFLRGVALAGIPAAMICGFLNLWWAMGCYTLEALIRGFVDTSVHTIPLELARHRSDQLDRINSRYELTFDLGGVAGPLILGGLMLWGGKVIPHILIPVGFALSAAAYFFIPSGMGREARTKGVNGSATQQVHHSHGGSWAGLKYILTKQPLLITCVGLMSFNIYPLRKLLSAFFAKGLLHKSATVGQIGAAFALGGVVGATIYALTKHRDSGAKWVALGAVGTFILAIGWLPANLWVMTAVVFLFAVTNVCARLTLTRKRQELTPLEHAGGVTSASQFGVNAVSVVVKTMVGAAFSAGMGAYGAFALVGGVLALMGAGQFALAKYLPKISSCHHKAS